MSAATATQNVETVKELYAAFLRGDVNAILDHVTDTVNWNNQGNAAREVPWNGDFTGRRNLPKFFAALQEHTDFATFEPKDFTSNDHHVAVRLRVELTLKKNGRKIANDSIHFWTFDDAGKVTAFRFFNDTAAELAAWRG